MGSIPKEWVLYPKNGFSTQRMGSIPKEWVIYSFFAFDATSHRCNVANTNAQTNVDASVNGPLELINFFIFLFKFHI